MLLIAVIIVVLLGSAIFSGTEAALFSIPLSKAMALAKENKRGADSLVKVKKSMSRPITMIVIFNNIVNIVGSILVGALVGETLGSAWLGAISAILTFLIIIFGEIIPKTIGENYTDKISPLIAAPLVFTTKIFTPLVWLIEKVTSIFVKPKNIVSEEEIKMMSHLGHLEGSIEKDEKEIIQNVFRLNDLKARDIMTPSNVVVAFETNQTVGELQEEIHKCPHSRLPIYKEDLNHVVGLCLRRDLFVALSNNEFDRTTFEFKRHVITVSEKSRVDYLLMLFQKEKSHLAIVQDEYRTTLGIVTLEDVLEELVGEIVDETDRTVDMQVESKRISRSQNNNAK